MMAKKIPLIGIVVMLLIVRSLATVYTVGDASGWALGVDYGTWSASKTFVVGDSLVFNYGSGHTVDEVKQGDYTTCTLGNALTSDNKGTTSILLQTPGTHYFICGIIGHCGNGMKLSINVLVSGGSSNSTSTSPPSTTTPTTCGTTTGTSPATTATYPTTTGTTNPYTIPYSSSTRTSIIFSSLHGLIIFVVALII